MWTRIAAVFFLATISQAAVGAPRGCPGWGRTTTPAPHPWPGGAESHPALIAKLPQATDVLLLGDSHVAIWPADLWHPLRSFNAGYGGDWIENLLWRLHAPEWRSITPRNVVVSIGTNNLARGDCAFAIIEGITTVLRRVRTLWPETRVFYLGIPMRAPQGSLRTAERVAINATLRRGLIATLVDPDPVLKCAGCFESAEIVHLSGEGYVALTTAVRPLIKGP